MGCLFFMVTVSSVVIPKNYTTVCCQLIVLCLVFRVCKQRTVKEPITTEEGIHMETGIVTLLSEKTFGDYVMTIGVIDYCCGSHWFQELYESSEHIAGTTVTSESASGHYIGQTTPAELSKFFAKEGRENPSKEAYDSLSKELEHYIKASDCSLFCRIEKSGVELAKTTGITSEYSDIYHDNYEDFGEDLLKEYGNDFINEAMIEARNTLVELNPNNIHFADH